MARVKFLLSSEGRSRFFDLDEGQEALVGRSLDAQFFLTAPSISRKHCGLRATPAGVEVVDYSSRKDCYVDGRRVVAPVVLREGTVLQIGGLPFSVSFPEGAPGTTRCTTCGKQCRPSELQGVDAGRAVCRECLASHWRGSQGRFEAALVAQGFRVLAQLGDRPPTFKVESNIGKLLQVQVLPLREEGDPETTQRLREEARAIARLAHEAIVPLYDIREAPGFILLVMGYHEGETLEDRVLRAGPLAPGEALAVGRSCLIALAHAAEHGVVHGDLRPANVVLTKTGGVQVTGFTLASDLVSLSLSFTSAGGQDVIGFMAPERLTQPGTTHQADIYAAGAVMLYALTGRPPYPDLSPADLIHRLGEGSLPELHLDGQSSEVQALLKRFLSAHPAHRPERPGVALAELDAAANATDSKAGKFEGKFQGNELIEFLQLIEFNQKTGVLEVRTSEMRGTVKFREGLVSGAETGEHQGLRALRRLLSQRQGKFTFTPCEPKDIEVGLAQRLAPVLIDVARAVDESGDDWSALKG